MAERLFCPSPILLRTMDWLKGENFPLKWTPYSAKKSPRKLVEKGLWRSNWALVICSVIFEKHLLFVEDFLKEFLEVLSFIQWKERSRYDCPREISLEMWRMSSVHKSWSDHLHWEIFLYKLHLDSGLDSYWFFEKMDPRFCLSLTRNSGLILLIIDQEKSPHCSYLNSRLLSCSVDSL